MFKVFCLVFTLTAAELRTDYNDEAKVRVNKCCEPYEIYMDNSCRHINETNETVWRPTFTTESGKTIKQVPHILVVGLPDCGSAATRSILHYKNSTDILRLLSDGRLRHYIYHEIPEEGEPEFETVDGKGIMFYDYQPGKYCMEKQVENNLKREYALVCVPEYASPWTSTEHLMRNVVNPVTHFISMTCFVFVAVIYFIMPTLRDLVGNIVTTLSLCMVISQAADMTRLLTVFVNHISLIGAETVCYFGLLGAFFWLNSLGYYIWKSFRSRNVYLRITDGRKYCYYSCYAWTCTIIMGALAVFAHYTMDYPQVKTHKENEQERIGSLAMIIFFMPVAFTTLVNIFFFASTLKILQRMKTYGRIHHKLKHSFRMFILLFLVMTLTWVFFLLSFSQYDVLIYCYVIVNALQAFLVLYVCIVNQRHVAFMLRKSCCYANCACHQPEPEIEWADEMTAMNTMT